MSLMAAFCLCVLGGSRRGQEEGQQVNITQPDSMIACHEWESGNGDTHISLLRTVSSLGNNALKRSNYNCHLKQFLLDY